MKLKFILIGLVSSAAAISSLSCTKSETKGPEKPNVVFFLVDDMGWTDLGCYGSSFYETPNIDNFAKEGVKFTNAYAACHVCSPTRASIMTGKYPATLDLTDWIPGRKDFDFQRLLNAEHELGLPTQEETIAEALKKEGYSTAIFGKWHLGGPETGPLEQGFDVAVPQNWYACCPNRTYHSPYGLDGVEDEEGGYLTDKLTDGALRFIDQNKDNPFFLYFSHFAVHDPIQGRKDLVEKYEGKLENVAIIEGPPYILEGNPDDENPPTRQDLSAFLDDPEYAGHSVLPNNTVKIKQWQDNTEFAGMVESVDESMGRVLAKLEELGLEDNTIIIFFSDNGGMAAGNWGNPERVVPDSLVDVAYATSNLPLRGAKGWLYEGGIREPLIIKWPGQGMKGTESDVPVISTDFFPTILDMLGLPIPTENKLDGVSIANLVKGQTELDREAIYWHFPHYSNHGMQSPGGAIRSGDYKLLEYFENGSVQLFNLKDDIGEQNDLAASEPEKVRELKAMLQKWREDIGANMMPPNPNYKL
ncbi:MAG: sulfatase [Bacteroidetes bacterium]|nr:sulfatase [Bacteroidota bacterium]MDA1122284.1 sulfatase [Bacteroidota bacterium]